MCVCVCVCVCVCERLHEPTAHVSHCVDSACRRVCVCVCVCARARACVFVRWGMPPLTESPWQGGGPKPFYTR